jgi:hypothetical protein
MQGMASPLAHRAVTAVAVTLGVGALAASASGMRSVDADLASATKTTQTQTAPKRTTVQDGDPVTPCPKPAAGKKDTAPAPADTGTDAAREL